MAKFTAHTKNDSFRTEITAQSIDNAALKAVRKLYRTRLIVRRVTGDPGLSGWFQGYIRVDRNTISSYGSPVHVA